MQAASLYMFIICCRHFSFLFKLPQFVLLSSDAPRGVSGGSAQSHVNKRILSGARGLDNILIRGIVMRPMAEIAF